MTGELYLIFMDFYLCFLRQVVKAGTRTDREVNRPEHVNQAYSGLWNQAAPYSDLCGFNFYLSGFGCFGFGKVKP